MFVNEPVNEEPIKDALIIEDTNKLETSGFETPEISPIKPKKPKKPETPIKRIEGDRYLTRPILPDIPTTTIFMFKGKHNNYLMNFIVSRIDTNVSGYTKFYWFFSDVKEVQKTQIINGVDYYYYFDNIIETEIFNFQEVIKLISLKRKSYTVMKNSIQEIKNKDPNVTIINLYETLTFYWNKFLKKIDEIMLGDKKQLLQKKTEFSSKLTQNDMTILYNNTYYIIDMMMKSIMYQIQFLDKVIHFKIEY